MNQNEKLAILAAFLFMISFVLFIVPLVINEESILPLFGLIPFVSGWIIIFILQKQLNKLKNE